MKTNRSRAVLLGIIVCLWAGNIWAQPQPASAPAPRLAIVSDSPDPAEAVDMLTASLTSGNEVQLLERADVERAYREQGMSAQNHNDLKLGQILGADGVLALEITGQGTNLWLSTRLVAVKPGVVLAADTFRWPLADVAEWSSAFAKHLEPLLPKLTVLANDALPISLVNLRSAVSSADAAEAERQLRLLTVERLSRERQFFVLERQKMAELGEEKELQGDESAFWDGSYLLEGVVDQNGYSQDIVTIDARLTPPKGGQPLLFEVSGSRTNYAEVVNQLAAKVIELLKVQPTGKAWDAAAEAQQYYQEAQWALKWQDSREAQSAADSAWALGKHDSDCARARVKAYECGLSPKEQFLENGVYTRAKVIPGPEQAEQETLQDLTPEQRDSVQFEWRGDDLYYTYISVPPDPGKLDQAWHMLQLYYDYSRTMNPADVKPDSPWYRTGIEALEAASQVLAYFHASPRHRAAVADKLAEVRGLARAVAAWISQCPAIHDTYWVGDRIVSYDELDDHLMETENIFKCEAQHGSLWQERPEDAGGMYRELAANPVFAYIHENVWNRDPGYPRLIAWNADDQPRIPALWEDFVTGLCNSSNVVQQVEGKMFRLRDARTEPDIERAFHDVIDTILTNHDEIAGNPVELLHMNWGIDDLVWSLDENFAGVENPTVEKLQQQYRTEFKPQLDAMDREYQDFTTQNGKIEAQKKYLRDFTPYDMSAFFETFDTAVYSKSQAAQLQPLLTAYVSNLNAQAVAATGKPLPASDSKLFFLNAEQQKLDAALKPPAPVATAVPPPVVVQPPHPPAPTPAAPDTTNVLLVDQFQPIPIDRLQDQFQGDHMSDIILAPPRLREGRLLFDFWSTYTKQSSGGGGDGYVFTYDLTYNGDASLIFNPVNGQWDIIFQPGTQLQMVKDAAGNEHMTSRPVNSELFNGAVYCSFPEEIQRFDLQTRQWQAFPFPGEKQLRLTVIQNRLLGADDEGIYEILDGGKSNRILASSRRRPAVTTLDSLDNLGHPVLFAGPGGSLRVAVQNEVYTWDSQDWHKDISLDRNTTPEVTGQGLVFRERSPNLYGQIPFIKIWWLAADQAALLLLWKETLSPPQNMPTGYDSRPQVDADQTKPIWTPRHGISLARTHAAILDSNLFFFAEHTQATNVPGRQFATEKDGRHADLICLDSPSTNLFSIAIRFDESKGLVPTSLPPNLGFSPDDGRIWMISTPDALLVGSSSYNPDYMMQMPGNSDGTNTGFWSIPLQAIEDVIEQQKKTLLTEASDEAVAAKEKSAALLAKYDLNHNGVIDPEEREAALDAPDFIAAQLDQIDANHNGILDPEELAWFDANHNKILDAKEQSGIDLAQHLLAVRLFNKFDADGDGILERSEYNNLLQTVYGIEPEPSRFPPGFVLPPGVGRPGHNSSGPVSLDELETFMKQQTRKAMLSGGKANKALLDRIRAGYTDGNPLTPAEIFKATVECYWQSPEALAK